MSNQLKAKFNMGQAVIIPKNPDLFMSGFSGHIAGVREFSNTYGYYVLPYYDDGQARLLGSDTHFFEKNIQADESHKNIQVTTGLEMDLKRNFEIGDPVIVDVAPLRRHAFEAQRSIFSRGKVAGIFLNAVASDDFWGRVQVGVKVEGSSEVKLCALKQVQYDWGNPGKPEILAP